MIYLFHYFYHLIIIEGFWWQNSEEILHVNNLTRILHSHPMMALKDLFLVSLPLWSPQAKACLDVQYFVTSSGRGSYSRQKQSWWIPNTYWRRTSNFFCKISFKATIQRADNIKIYPFEHSLGNLTVQSCLDWNYLRL